MTLAPFTPADEPEVRRFLVEVDLTLAGLEDPALRLWLERDADGTILGSTGFELSEDGAHALVRSVAVAPDRRASGTGSRLARHALSEAAAAGAGTAWLFSRRSGPFWTGLGFVRTDCSRLAAALARTHQVRLFEESGQLSREIAWTRPLP